MGHRRNPQASPTGGVIDSQSVKAPEGKTRGYDAGKKIVGRKRHVAVDTDGRLLMVNLTTADISDSAGAQMILDTVRKRWPWLKHLFADGAYDRTQLMDKAAFLDFTVEIIRRSYTAKGLRSRSTSLDRRAHLRVDDGRFAGLARILRPVADQDPVLNRNAPASGSACPDRCFLPRADAPPSYQLNSWTCQSSAYSGIETWLQQIVSITAQMVAIRIKGFAVNVGRATF